MRDGEEASATPKGRPADLTAAVNTSAVELIGVSTNNLKAIDVAFPLGEVTVVTGVSGSGKSSLVFDTLYGEAYRRYVESLSSFARQYMQSMPKPAIRQVRNLPPAIAVKQTHSTANSRSTVGTATELIDLLRVVYTHLAEIRCYSCGGDVKKDHPEGVAAHIETLHVGRRLLIAAPLERWGKVAAKELKAQLEAQGFTRLRTLAGDIVKLLEAKATDLKGAAVIVDRITVQKGESDHRLRESLNLAFKVGRGKAHVISEGQPPGHPPDLFEAFSRGLDCPRCGIEYQEPSTALLSFNHPLGACGQCQGFGFAADLDWEKIIPDKSKSLSTNGVAAWNFGKFAEYYSWAQTSAGHQGINYEKPFSDYTSEEWAWLLQGKGREFDGINGFFAYLESKKYKAHYRIHAARFRRYVLCPTCKGDRLSPKALACHVLGQNIAETSRLALKALAEWVEKLPGSQGSALRGNGVTGPGALEPTPRDLLRGGSGELAANRLESGMLGVQEALEEMRARLRYLLKIGVAYLALDRPARTLSGGELQRINMARCLGSALTDTLFCLDEPSSGLHARDSHNLLEVIRELRGQGNTVVMVEHERQLIAGADHLLEVGPKAGHEGGYLVYAGVPRKKVGKTLEDSAFIGADAGVDQSFPTLLAAGKVNFLELRGARTHNLRGIDVRIPVGAITAVCGVSGSGKTSLIQHTLYPLLARTLGQAIDLTQGLEPIADSVGPAALVKTHAAVMLVSQASLGRSSRSNIATYLGVMDEIRKLLAAEPMAKKLGLTAGSFSFNNSKERGGGRCETCEGLGTVVEDLSFLGDMEVVCPACNGCRFADRVLQVEVLGRNLIEILRLTVAEAREVFFDRPQMVKTLDQVIGMGLGYLTLGQSTSSFSGGEAQRLKLLSLMRETKAGKPSILILDEPTTGLSDADVANLLVQLRTLADQGHTLIVIEHHLDVLKFADWLLEIGPEAAENGGALVYAGSPDGLKKVPGSLTRPFLWGNE